MALQKAPVRSARPTQVISEQLTRPQWWEYSICRDAVLFCCPVNRQSVLSPVGKVRPD